MRERVRERGNDAKQTDKNLSLFTSHLSLKRAFTLAEVLITLGIIGVVAAMTMPTLIAKHQKNVIENQLKKSYATFSNAVRMSEIDNGPMKDWSIGADMDINTYWDTYLNPYFNNAKVCNSVTDCGLPNSLGDGSNRQYTGETWGLVTNDSRILFQLIDGTIIFLPRNTWDADRQPLYVSSFYIDVNGAKNPNTYCKDVFIFQRNTDKGISPSGCTLELAKNGWKFPDNYSYWQN